MGGLRARVEVRVRVMRKPHYGGLGMHDAHEELHQKVAPPAGIGSEVGSGV